MIEGFGLPARAASNGRSATTEALKPMVLASSHDRLREAAKTLFAERGYELTSTADICRLAGTSQSQLIKHFGNKRGLLEAIFERAWEQINPAISLALQRIAAPKEKLKILIDMLLTFLGRDKDLRTLLLLEGRRYRGDGPMLMLAPGFLEFIKMLDGIFKEMTESGELGPELHPQVVRSALMGALEGMLRDQLISKRARLPASYGDADIAAMSARLLSCCLADSMFRGVDQHAEEPRARKAG